MANITVKIEKDDITPALHRAIAGARNKRPILLAMGQTFKSITEGTFNSVGASYRPTPWKPKRDGTPSILQKSTMMAKSFHLEVSGDSATVSNSTIYAAIHQLGGVIRPKNKKALRFFSGGKWWMVKQVTMPARPFFPVLNGKLTEKAAKMIGNAARRVVERMFKG